MNVPFVDLKAQYSTIRDEIHDAMENILENTAFIGGKPVADFEKAFAAYCGTSFCVGTSSGTSALHVALSACGVGEGDEVITVPNTFIATAEAIEHSGAAFRFVDVDEATSNIDPALIEEAITPKTKAIMPVHLYGRPAPIDEILGIAEKHGLMVIADSAQAHGAVCNGKKMGEGVRAAGFSFYPGKNLGAYGDAGALVTNDEKVAEKARSLIDHGRKDKFAHSSSGFNYRLDAMQAAILDVKLRHLDEWIENRRRVAARYRELLAPLDIEVARHDADCESVYHIFPVWHDDRDRLRERLGERGIACGIHYPIPLHLQEAYARLGLGEGDFPVAERLARRELSLPVYPEMTDEQIEYVAGALAEELA